MIFLKGKNESFLPMFVEKPFFIFASGGKNDFWSLTYRKSLRICRPMFLQKPKDSIFILLLYDFASLRPMYKSIIKLHEDFLRKSLVIKIPFL